MSLLEDVREQGYSTEPAFDEQIVDAWREDMIASLMQARAAWPGAPTRLEPEDARATVAVFEETLRRVDARLRETYGVAHHHNVQDPMAEVLLILISRKTPEDAYLRAFERLLGSVDSWQEVRDLDEDELFEMVQDGGLGQKKVTAIRELLELVEDTFGEYSLEATREWEDARLKKFLMSVPEVGPKSALCVMMYAMERAAFPVDAHVGRTLMRMGMFELVGLNLSRLDHKQKQRHLEELVPPDLRYSLHVLCLSLGRDLCGAGRPRCHACPLGSICAHGLDVLQAASHEEE